MTGRRLGRAVAAAFSTQAFKEAVMVRSIAALATVAVLSLAGGLTSPALAQGGAAIEGELNLITPVSKFIHDAALKAFADYAKERWNVTVKVSAIPAGTPVAYGRIVEWKGKPGVDSVPASIGKPKPIPLKDKDGFWVGTALEPYGLVYNPKRIQRLGVPEP